MTQQAKNIFLIELFDFFLAAKVRTKSQNAAIFLPLLN
jgi:hypothetical protein